MAEELAYTSPVISPQKTSTGVKVKSLFMEVELGLFVLVVRGTQGEIVEAQRNGAAALTLMRQLNTANLTIKSLHRRALEWLATQPEGAGLQGTITGAPD